MVTLEQLWDHFKMLIIRVNSFLISRIRAIRAKSAEYILIKQKSSMNGCRIGGTEKYSTVAKFVRIITEANELPLLAFAIGLY